MPLSVKTLTLVWDSSCIEVVQDELIRGFGFGYFLMKIKIIIQPALPQSSFYFGCYIQNLFRIQGASQIILFNVLIGLYLLKASGRFPSWPL